MSESAFPSGPWTGFYAYQTLPGKHRMDLILEFVNGRITGEGNDSVGPFVISGQYDSGTRECYWTKSYVAAHDVFYRGVRQAKGIAGSWEIGTDWRGGFHIWPLAEGESASYVEKAEESLASAIGVEV